MSVPELGPRAPRSRTERDAAGGDRGQVPGAVEAVGQRVVDDLDLGVGEHVGVAAGDPLDPVPGGEGLGARPVAGRHPHQAAPGGPGGAGQGQAGDPRGAGRAPARQGQDLGRGGRLTSGGDGPPHAGMPEPVLSWSANCVVYRSA